MCCTHLEILCNFRNQATPRKVKSQGLGPMGHRPWQLWNSLSDCPAHLELRASALGLSPGISPSWKPLIIHLVPEGWVRSPPQIPTMPCACLRYVSTQWSRMHLSSPTSLGWELLESRHFFHFLCLPCVSHNAWHIKCAWEIIIIIALIILLILWKNGSMVRGCGAEISPLVQYMFKVRKFGRQAGG